MRICIVASATSFTSKRKEVRIQESRPGVPMAKEVPMKAVLEPIEWPCRLDDLRPGPAIIIATPQFNGRLIFKSEYTENEKIIAYNEAGEYLCMEPGTIVQAVFLTWQEK